METFPQSTWKLKTTKRKWCNCLNIGRKIHLMFNKSGNYQNSYFSIFVLAGGSGEIFPSRNVWYHNYHNNLTWPADGGSSCWPAPSHLTSYSSLSGWDYAGVTTGPENHGIISHVKLNMLYLCNNMFCHATYFGLGKYYRQILANHAMDGIFRVWNFIIFWFFVFFQANWDQRQLEYILMVIAVNVR